MRGIRQKGPLGTSSSIGGALGRFEGDQTEGTA
jgi:hypothetical protein